VRRGGERRRGRRYSIVYFYLSEYIAQVAVGAVNFLPDGNSKHCFVKVFLTTLYQYD